MVTRGGGVGGGVLEVAARTGRGLTRPRLTGGTQPREGVRDADAPLLSGDGWVDVGADGCE